MHSLFLHTLGPGALSILQMMIFVNAHAEFFHLLLIQQNALLQML
jgi:hypothetical protein